MSKTEFAMVKYEEFWKNLSWWDRIKNKIWWKVATVWAALMGKPTPMELNLLKALKPYQNDEFKT